MVNLIEKMAISKEVTKKFLNIAYGVSKLIDKEEELKEWAIPLINTSIQEILCNDLDEAIKTFEKVIEMVQEFMKNPEKWKDTMATQSRMGNKLVNIDECVKYDEENVTEISEDDRYSHINVSDGIKYCVPEQDVIIWDEYDEDYRLINRHTNKHQDEREEQYHDNFITRKGALQITMNECNMDNKQHELLHVHTISGFNIKGEEEKEEKAKTDVKPKEKAHRKKRRKRIGKTARKRRIDGRAIVGVHGERWSPRLRSNGRLWKNSLFKLCSAI